MAEHHKEHPDYAEMGIFAGYGEFDDPKYEVTLEEALEACREYQLDGRGAWVQDKETGEHITIVKFVDEVPRPVYTKVCWGFKSKTQLPLFMVWREYRTCSFSRCRCDGSCVEFATVLFNSRDWIGF